MSYTISEKNLERQMLLAEALNPFTTPHLTALDVNRSGRWLDVGSGLGATTRMLTQFLESRGECVGLEQDPALIEIAQNQDWGEQRVTFRQGDAMDLPFDDNSFDFVFTRYLLVHLPDPLAALREMFRVAKPGALVFAQEPDLTFNCCYPSSPGYERIPEMWSALFPDIEIGRKLVHLFRGVGDVPLEVRADIGIEAEGVNYRRAYTLTFEAIGQALVTAGQLDSEEFDSLLDDFREVESDSSRVVISNPIISVWGQV